MKKLVPACALLMASLLLCSCQLADRVKKMDMEQKGSFLGTNC